MGVTLCTDNHTDKTHMIFYNDVEKMNDLNN